VEEHEIGAGTDLNGVEDLRKIHEVVVAGARGADVDEIVGEPGGSLREEAGGKRGAREQRKRGPLQKRREDHNDEGVGRRNAAGVQGSTRVAGR
jgi:hypothetical protein